MGIKRIVDTDFWTDDKVVECFSVEDKLFMLYLLTNPHSTQLGIYKTNERLMSFETGLPIEEIYLLIEKFESEYGIIKYSKQTKEIAIKNALRYNIVKGGKPVENLLQKELSAVRDRSLIDFVFKHLSKYSNISTTVMNVLSLLDIDRDNNNNNIYSANNTINNNVNNNDNVNDIDNVNDNDNDNDNDVSQHDTVRIAHDTVTNRTRYGHESYHDVRRIAHDTVTNREEQFEKFMRMYPKEVKPTQYDDLVRAWNDNIQSDNEASAAIDALYYYRESDDWCKEEGRYIPNAINYLRDRLFERKWVCERIELDRLCGGIVRPDE